MRHRSIKSRAGKAAVGAVLAGALGIFAVNTAEATLTLDLRAQDGTKAVNVASGAPVTLNIFAVVQGTNGDIADDGFGQLFAAFEAVPSGPTATIGSTVASPFNVLGSNAGDVNGLRVGPDASVLTNSDTDSPGAVDWFFATYRTATEPLQVITFSETSAAGTALSFKIGELTVTPTGTGSVAVKAFGRTRTQANVVPATWVEDNVVKQVAEGSSFLLGTDVTITIGGPPALKGDVNNDGFVNAGDINPFVFALSNDAAAFAAQFPTGSYPNADTNNDTFVNAGDINPFVAILSGGPSVAAFAAIPEPASFGLVSLGAVAALARRKRNG